MRLCCLGVRLIEITLNKSVDELLTGTKVKQLSVLAWRGLKVRTRIKNCGDRDTGCERRYVPVLGTIFL